MLKNKPFWFSIALITAYLLAGFFAVPHWLQPRLEQYILLQLGRQLQFEKLRFDPLTWSAELTGVRLANGEPGTADAPGLFPDTELTAKSVHLRFNFWRMRAAVSTLRIKAPVLTIDGNSELMQSGHYPFVSQWQQWRSAIAEDEKHWPVSIQQWRLDAGRMAMTSRGPQKAEKTMLDELFMQAFKADDVGNRKYELTFTAAEGSAISMHGQLDLSSFSSTGLYEWEATLPREELSGFRRVGVQAEVNSEIKAVGEFSISTQSDLLYIELTESVLSSDQAERCVLNGLLCARIYPLNCGFSAQLQASTDGVRLLNAQMDQAAFALDASLAEGAVILHQPRVFDSAHLQLEALPESADRVGKDLLADDTLEFELQLQSSDPVVNVNLLGQFHPQSEHADMRFSSRGELEFRGDLHWQLIAAQHAKAAYPQFELRLENPVASLAQSFIVEHLSDQVGAAALELKLSAVLKEQQLRFTENIRLKQVSLSATGSPKVPNSGPAGAPTLDSIWLLALLQSPQSAVELDIPEQYIPLTEQRSLKNLLHAPILTYLNQVSSQPFDGLALQMAYEGQNLNEVQFESGSAELNAGSTESLKVVAEALLHRPGLGIELAGVYDPLIDRKALQIEQIRTHIALATAAALAFRSGSEPPDFNDPTVHSVIDEFARRRLPTDVLSAFAELFGEADVDRGVMPEGDIAAYYSALFELLVDYAEIPQGALSTLAHYRAQAVIESLTGQGVPRERLHVADQPLSSAAELDGVPLHLQLSIHSAESVELPQASDSGLNQENGKP